MLEEVDMGHNGKLFEEKPDVPRSGLDRLDHSA